MHKVEEGDPCLFWVEKSFGQEYNPATDRDDPSTLLCICTEASAASCSVLTLETTDELREFVIGVGLVKKTKTSKKIPTGIEARGFLLDVLHKYSGAWYDVPANLCDRFETYSFESLYIGRIQRVYEAEDCMGEALMTEDTSCHPHMDANCWVCYRNRFWVRTNDYADRMYLGPYGDLVDAYKEFMRQFAE